MAIGDNEKQKCLATSREKPFLMGKGVYVLFCFVLPPEELCHSHRLFLQFLKLAKPPSTSDTPPQAE